MTPFIWNRPELKVPATTTDHILELVTSFFLILMWVFGILLYIKITNRVPTHFDLLGNPNALGNKNSFLVTVFVGTLAILLCAFSAYFPKMVNLPIRLKPKCINDQYALMARMMRILNIDLSIMFLSIILIQGVSLLNWNSRIFVIIESTCIFFIFILIVYYTSRIWSIGRKYKYFK